MAFTFQEIRGRGNDVGEMDGAVPVMVRLKQARLETGRTVEGLAEELNIRVGQLEALEDGRFDALPALAYVLGFVRSYARAVGLDADTMVLAFKQERQIDRPQSDLNFPKPIGQSKLPGRLVFATSVVATLLLYGFFLTDSGPALFAEGSVSPVTQTAALPSAAVLPEPASTLAGDLAGDLARDLPTDSAQDLAQTQVAEPDVAAAAGPAETPAEIIVRAHHDAWVRISDPAGQTVYSGVLRAGSDHRLPVATGLVLTTTNAGAVSVAIGDEVIDRLGPDGAMAQSLPLDGERLKAMAALALR
ncbi:MAG: RodZ domain-containing protein [Rhodothalassiaceae bacterium]